MNWKAASSKIARVAMTIGLLSLVAFTLYVWVGLKEATVTIPVTQAIVPIELPPMSEPKVEDPAPGSIGALGVGETRTIDFVADPADLGDDPAQREEQLRNWILRVVVARAGLPGSLSALLAAALDGDLSDGPVGRSPGLGPGPVRWIETAPGEAFALIPAKDDDSRRADLARVADELAWKNHQLPRRLSVFQYQVDSQALKARVTRRAPIERSVLFSPEYGYHEKLVVSKADLRDLLATVDDVAAIRDANDERRLGVWIGGRRLKARRPHGLSPADALAAWEGFERANNEIWQFGKWADEQVAAFNAWSREQSNASRQSWESSNQDIKERWLLSADVDEEVSELERQATAQAKNVQESLNSRHESLLVALRERREEMQENVKRAWSEIPDAQRSGWEAVVLDR